MIDMVQWYNQPSSVHEIIRLNPFVHLLSTSQQVFSTNITGRYLKYSWYIPCIFFKYVWYIPGIYKKIQKMLYIWYIPGISKVYDHVVHIRNIYRFSVEVYETSGTIPCLSLLSVTAALESDRGLKRMDLQLVKLCLDS